MALTDVPSKILVPLVSDADRAYLTSLSDHRLMVLQNQLSFGGAIVARFISDMSRTRDLAIKRGGDMEEELKEKLKGAEAALEKMKVEMTNQKNSALIESNDLSEQITELNLKASVDKEEKESLGREIEKLKGEKKRMEEKLNAEREAAKKSWVEHHKHIQDLDKQIAELKETPSAAPTISEEEAKAVYMGTEDYQLAMGDFGEYGFELLKSALVKKGLLDKATLDSIDYVDCIDKSSKGLL